MDSFYWWKHWGSEKSCELPKVTGAKLNPLEAWKCTSDGILLCLLSMWQAPVYLHHLTQFLSPPQTRSQSSLALAHRMALWLGEVKSPRLLKAERDEPKPVWPKGCARSMTRPVSPGDDGSTLRMWGRVRQLLDPSAAGVLWLCSGPGATETHSIHPGLNHAVVWFWNVCSHIHGTSMKKRPKLQDLACHLGQAMQMNHNQKKFFAIRGNQ